MSVLGQTSKDRFAEAFGTGFFNFDSATGLRGLARTQGSKLELLALLSNHRGSLRRFLSLAKMEFATVCVWHIINPALDEMLQQQGFVRATETDPRSHETLIGWRWPAGEPVCPS